MRALEGTNSPPPPSPVVVGEAVFCWRSVCFPLCSVEVCLSSVCSVEVCASSVVFCLCSVEVCVSSAMLCFYHVVWSVAFSVKPFHVTLWKSVCSVSLCYVLLCRGKSEYLYIIFCYTVFC